MKRYNYDEEIKQMYSEGLSCRIIGQKLNINAATVFNTLKRLNIPLRKKNGQDKLIEEVIDVSQLIKDYTTHLMSAREIGIKYGIATNTVKNILKKNNVVMRPKATTVTWNPLVNESYFENIDSKDKAYFLGFFIADGNVLKDNSVRMQLKESDKYILECFSKQIGLNNPLGVDKRDNSFIFHVKSPKMVSDLEKLNIVPNKTFTVKVPIINESLYSHLIRGLIDGDGWFTNYTNHRGKEVGAVGLCGNKFVVTFVRDYLVEKLDVYPAKILDRGTLYQVLWCAQKDIIKIGNFIYKDSDEFKLIRKYQTFMHLKSIYENTELT